jgi:hypothetical protein
MNTITKLLVILLLSPGAYMFAGERNKVPTEIQTEAEEKIDQFFVSLTHLPPEEAMSRIDNAVNKLIGEAKDLQNEVILTHKEVVYDDLQFEIDKDGLLVEKPEKK